MPPRGRLARQPGRQTWRPVGRHRVLTERLVGGGHIAFEFAHVAARAGAYVRVLRQGLVTTSCLLPLVISVVLIGLATKRFARRDLR